ncbi:MAG: hypothetical protein JXB49_23945 [Bacteroidales bacterium]|nr:hypothetical protein [Bacteroidales bacterium]
MKQKSILIQDAQNLYDLLGDSFILLTGSAISGANYPCVPMVIDVMEKIFEIISINLRDGAFEERIVSNYAKSLCKNGKYHYLLNSTKFEEFLGILQLILGRTQLNKLLKILYLCHPDEYGPNQKAISWLLENQKCIICLTTNFDNSLENASDHIETYSYIDYLNIISKIGSVPIQLKLHGNVRNNSCVATNKAIFKHTSVKTYDFLIELLKDKNILVLGYSGNGDIDIYPNLSQSKDANFFWCEYKANKTVPDCSKYKVICDLGSSDPNKNLLLGLAICHGWNSDDKGCKHDWENILEKWCDSINHEKLARILIQVLIKKPDWQVVHVMTFYPYTIYSDNIDINRGIACLQKSAYGIAEKIFTNLINNTILNKDQLVTAKLYLGFVQWRMGKFKKSLQTLWWFYSIDSYGYTEMQKVQISDGHRVYLEVIRDWMQLQSSKQRRQRIYESYKTENMLMKFKSLKTFDFAEDILKKVIILHIIYLKEGRKDKEFVNDVKKLFRLCYDTKNWDIAEAVGRLFVSVSFTKGLLALLRIDYELIKRKQINILRKSLAAILNKITLGTFPWFTIGLIDSPILYNIVSVFRNSLYQYKVSRWLKQKDLEENKDIF